MSKMTKKTSAFENELITIEGLDRSGFPSQFPDENSPIKTEVVHALMAYIEPRLKPIKSFNTDLTSYGLKHLIEEKIGQYVSNGELILAMVNCGFKYKICGSLSPNCWFNVSNKSIRLAYQEIYQKPRSSSTD